MTRNPYSVVNAQTRLTGEDHCSTTGHSDSKGGNCEIPVISPEEKGCKDRLQGAIGD